MVLSYTLWVLYRIGCYVTPLGSAGVERMIVCVSHSIIISTTNASYMQKQVHSIHVLCYTLRVLLSTRSQVLKE